MLKAFIKDLSGIPEETQALYKKVDDGYMVDIEAVDGYALEDLAPLKSTLNRLKGDIDGYKNIINTIPENFDFEANERKLVQLAKQQGFDPDAVRKELKIEIQENADNEFKKLIGEKDTMIDGLKQGMTASARESLYGKLQAQGWDKIVVQGMVESMTKVDIGENGANVTYINPDGSNRTHVEKNGDQRAYNDGDLVNYLTEHKVFGKLVETKANTGNGGQQQYSTNQQPNNKVISNRDVGNNLADLASGKVRLAE